MISAISVKDRIKNKAVSCSISVNDLLQAYGLERTVYRISVSEFSDRFTLKGGIFLYALFDGEFARATRDIDLLAYSMSNNEDNMKKVFESILETEVDDALKYDLSTLKVKNITEFKKYHGVNISVMSYLDRTRIPISIDIGFNDIVYPERVEMEFPVLLDMEHPKIYAYSIYSVIAEKFEAIVSLGDANSRYKDFYDIYLIAENYELDGEILKDAVQETFAHRNTTFNDIFAFKFAFINSPIHNSRWDVFLNKKKATVKVELERVIVIIRDLLLPISESIISGKEFTSIWNNKDRAWQ